MNATMHGVKLPVLLKIFDKQEFVSMFEDLYNYVWRRLFCDLLVFRSKKMK